MMCFKSCWRVHVLFLFEWQWGVLASWNKTFCCSFQAWLQIKSRSRVGVKAGRVFVSRYLVVLMQVPGECQIVKIYCFKGHLGPPEEARLWGQRLGQLNRPGGPHGCPDARKHRKRTGHLTAPTVGSETIFSKSFDGWKSENVSVLPNKRSVRNLLSPYRSWHVLCFISDESEQFGFVGMTCSYGGRFRGDKHSSDQRQTLSDKGLHDCEATVAGGLQGSAGCFSVCGT